MLHYSFLRNFSPLFIYVAVNSASQIKQLFHTQQNFLAKFWCPEPLFMRTLNNSSVDAFINESLARFDEFQLAFKIIQGQGMIIKATNVFEAFNITISFIIESPRFITYYNDFKNCTWYFYWSRNKSWSQLVGSKTEESKCFFFNTYRQMQW